MFGRVLFEDHDEWELNLATDAPVLPCGVDHECGVSPTLTRVIQLANASVMKVYCCCWESNGEAVPWRDWIRLW